MSELRSVAEALRSETLAELPDARLVQDFRELHQAGELIEVERLRRLAEIERRGLFSQDGHLSATSWLASEFKVSGGLASEQVRVARSLEQMPATRGALEIAAVSLSQVRVLASAREQDPKAFSRSEASLVEAARIHSVRDLQRIAADWRQKIDRESSEEKLRARRRLHASQTPVGMVRVDGELDPETGETLLTALGAVLDAEARSGEEDPRSPAQRRADALGEICRGWLDLADRPGVAGERPHLTVIIDADAIKDASAGPAELDHVGPVSPKTARRLGATPR